VGEALHTAGLLACHFNIPAQERWIPDKLAYWLVFQNDKMGKDNLK